MSSAVVDRIREALNRQDGISAETMSALAVSYGMEVETVNERLGVCVGLLRKGLRSEAIQQANIRPSLVDWCAKLDFPEIEEWYEILQFLQVKLPRSLNRDWARQLQEALIEEQPLEQVLRQHRRLAIAKAPLAWRLKVLRRIASIDAANPVWQEDIESWEKARLREVGAELDRAVKEQNFEAVSAISAELSGNEWRIPPSAEFVKSAQQAADRLEYATQTAQLRSIAEQLNNEFCSQDEASCRSQRVLYHQILHAMKGLVPTEIHQLAEPALLWLEQRDVEQLEQESHLQAVADLEAEINRGRSILDLQKAYSTATRSGQEIDPVIERRYRTVLTELQLSGRRKLVVRVAAIVVTAIIGLAAFGIWQWRSIQEREVATSTAALKQLIDDKKLQEAKQYLDNLRSNNPKVANSVSVSALASDLEGRIKVEAERQANFDDLIAKADNEDPAKIDLGLLVNAEKIAANDGEKAVTARIRRRRSEYDSELERKQLVDLKAELETVVRELDGIEAKAVSQVHEKDVDRWITQLEQMRTKYGRTGTNGQALVDVVKKRANNLRNSIAMARVNQQGEEAALEKLRGANSLPALKQALSEFASAAPKSAMITDVQTVISEFPLWTRVDEWNAVTQKVREFVNTKSPDKALPLLNALDEIDTKLKANPALGELETFRSTLSKIGARKEILAEVTNKLNRDVRTGLYTIVGTTDKSSPKQRFFAYASTVDPVKDKFGKGSIGLEVVTGADGTVNRESFVGEISISKEPQKSFDTLASQFKANTGELLKNWEAEMLKRLAEVMKNTDLDASMKELLMARILEAGCKGSHYLELQQASNLEFLQTRTSQNRTWHQATAPRVDIDTDVRKTISPSLSEAYNKVKQADLPLERLASKRMRFVGFVFRTDEGTAEAKIVESGNMSGALIVIRSADVRGENAALAEVGSIQNGKVKLTGSASQLATGRPLFLMSSGTTE